MRPVVVNVLLGVFSNTTSCGCRLIEPVDGDVLRAMPYCQGEMSLAWCSISRCCMYAPYIEQPLKCIFYTPYVFYVDHQKSQWLSSSRERNHFIMKNEGNERKINEHPFLLSVIILPATFPSQGCLPCFLFQRPQPTLAYTPTGWKRERLAIAIDCYPDQEREQNGAIERAVR